MAAIFVTQRQKKRIHEVQCEFYMLQSMYRGYYELQITCNYLTI
jgi:hypothetical protein